MSVFDLFRTGISHAVAWNFCVSGTIVREWSLDEGEKRRCRTKLLAICAIASNACIDHVGKTRLGAEAQLCGRVAIEDWQHDLVAGLL